MNESASPTELTFTGERFIPQHGGEIAYEHWHRYAFARGLARGKRVLDVASGEGYGAALMASVAREVDGVDISAAALAQALVAYGDRPNLRFTRASCTALPYGDATFDLVVSFETVEHIDAAAQRAMLAEFRRVLRSDGLLVLSSPNKAEYSDARNYRNEFHVHELYRDELKSLVGAYFPAMQWFRQRLQFWSGLWSECSDHSELDAWRLLEGGDTVAYTLPEAMYFVIVAASDPSMLPGALRVSLFTDEHDSVFQRYESAQREVMRVDHLLLQRDSDLALAAQVRTHHEGLIAERDARLAACDVRIAEQEAAIAERERLIANRETLIAERDTWLQERHEHIAHLERLVVEREQLIAQRDDLLVQRNAQLAERDAALAERTARVEGLAAKLAEREMLIAEVRRLAQERLDHIARQETELRRQHALLQEREAVIAYRQRWLWWLQLPWFRFRTFLKRIA